MIVIAAGLLLILLVLITRQDVAVARVRAVLGRGVRGGGVTALAQTAIRPRMMGPTLLSDRGADRGRAYVLDVADALYSPMPFTATSRHRPRRQLRRRRRVAADAAAHVLALTGEAPGV